MHRHSKGHNSALQGRQGLQSNSYAMIGKRRLTYKRQWRKTDGADRELVVKNTWPSIRPMTSSSLLGQTRGQATRPLGHFDGIWFGQTLHEHEHEHDNEQKHDIDIKDILSNKRFVFNSIHTIL